MGTIQLIQVSPVELTAMIAEAVKMILPSPKDEDVLMNSEQVAEYLDIDVSTLQRWKKAGKITAYAIEGIVRYKKSEILQLLKPLK